MVDAKSIFTLNDDDIAKTDKEKDAQPETNKQEQVRKMSGFDSIGEVKRSAPSGYQDAPPSQQPVKRRVSASSIRQSKEDAEKEEKEKRKQAAIATIGKRYSRLLAETPYDLWSRFAEDPALSLTKEESEELAGAYFELAQALNPDLTSWPVLLGGVIYINLIMVGRRLKHIKQMELTDAEERAEKEAQEKLRRAELGIAN